MLGAGKLSAIYFITLILFGNIIMLNLFLAILLGNFGKARTFWLKKNIFEMFEVAIEKKYSLSKAINIILGEVSKSVKEELLVHEPRDIFRLNGRLSIINRKLMINDPEAEDKLIYYDKVADFALDYQPIINDYFEEKYEDADDQENDELDLNQDNNHINKLNSQINLKKSDSQPEDYEEFKRDKNQEYQPMIMKLFDLQDEESVNHNRSWNKLELKPKRSNEPFIENDIHIETLNNQENISEDNFKLKRYVSFESQRRDIKDLEENDESNVKIHRRLMSVSFDLNNLKEIREKKKLNNKELEK